MKLAFIFNPDIPPFAALAGELQRRYGLFTPAEADILVPVGGDGSVLCALPEAEGKKVYGIVPADSNSVAYTANRFAPGDDLLTAIAESRSYPVYSLLADVEQEKGAARTLRAFNCFCIERDSAQAAFFDLTGAFNRESMTLRLVGDGLSFSTPLGSTALNYSQGGPILPLVQPAFVMAGMGIGMPRGVSPVLAGPEDEFTVGCVTSRGKRPLRLNLDGHTLRPEESGDAYRSVRVRLDVRPYAELALGKATFHPFRRWTL